MIGYPSIECVFDSSSELAIVRALVEHRMEQRAKLTLHTEWDHPQRIVIRCDDARGAYVQRGASSVSYGQQPARARATLTTVAFEADVIVLSHDVPEVRLVAEVKRTIPNLGEAEAQMRRYMLDRRCSLALLVTPERTRIYRDTYADYTDATVQFVGEFSTADLLDLDQVPTDEHALQDAVREWLDRLAISWPSALPKSAAARDPVLQYLVPEITDGRVSSGSLG